MNHSRLDSRLGVMSWQRPKIRPLTFISPYSEGVYSGTCTVHEPL